MTTIEEILKAYDTHTLDDVKSALREIVQNIVLVGLSRAGFFTKASFYGGTALRIFYGLNRYSEDLDFTLNEKNEDFTLLEYTDKIREVALSYGLNLDIVSKTKKTETPAESAFAKLNTYQTFITLKISENLVHLLHKDEVIKVKFEIDCNPALGFKTESKWTDIPEFAPVIVLDEPSLFAGKIHAILCRTYKNTVKGRDYYDFLFYASRHVKPNLEYLKNKLTESGKLSMDEPFDMEVLKAMLKEKFGSVDYRQVQSDAQRFVLKNENLAYYSEDLFLSMTDKL